MAKSREFDREGDADPKEVVKKTGPLGLLPILYISASLVLIIVALIWWATR